MQVMSPEALENVITREKNNKGASFTIKSIASGKDYTFKIARSEFKGRWYTHVSVETRYMEFKRLGTYFNGQLTHKREAVQSPSAAAIAFVLAKVEAKKFDWLNEKVEIMHLGSCLCCGKTLTDAESIARGLGPICAKL